MVINNTQLKVLSLFLSDPGKEYSIRDIAIKTGINYKLVYNEIIKLIQNNILFMEKKGHSNFCKLNISNSISLYVYIESLRKEEIQKKYSFVKVICNELLKLPYAYYSALLFGSYVKETVTKRSDIDLLFIIPNNLNIEEFQQKVSSLFSSLSYSIDANVISEESFLEMKKTTELNIANEIFGNHIIFFGGESYYKLLTK